MGCAPPVLRQTSAQEESQLPWPSRREGPHKGRSKLLDRALHWWSRDVVEFQAGQLGTPTWWEEQGAMLGIEDWCKFAQKIRASFYVPEVQLRESLEWGYTVPLAPRCLNRSAFLLERLTYQNVRQQPALLTIAYAQCLQHWAEKHNPPKNPDFHPWAERWVVANSMRFRGY